MFTLATVIFSFLFVYFRFSFTRYYVQATPEMLTNGTAFVPFQYRALIPLLVHGLVELFPNTRFMSLYQVFEFIATVGLCFAFRHYLSFFLPNPLLSSSFALSLFYSLPFNFLNGSWYPSDIPSVLFFTLGLVLLYRQNWRWYYPLFIVATVNRETTLFLTLLYVAVSFGKVSSRELMGHVVVQFCIWIAIKALLYELYLNNPRLGYGLFQIQLLGNMIRVKHPYKVFLFLTNWGLIWLPLVMGHSMIRPDFVRRSLLVPIVQIALLSIVGVLTEMRIYGEMIPVVLTAFVLVMYEVGQSIAMARLKQWRRG